MQNNQTNTFLKGMNLDVAKEFVSSDQYIDAMNVHVVSTDGNSSGTLQMYSDLSTIDSNTLKGLTILGTTTGHIYNPTYKCKQQCFIVLAVDAEGYNHLKVYDAINNEELWCFATSDLKFNTSSKLVNLYESEEISRVYICQKNSYVCAININEPNPEQVYTNGYDFSIFPQCGALPPFRFNGVLPGSKTAGKVQYAYQLFDKHGKTTALSAISYAIPVGNELQNDITTEGISIKLDSDFTSYSHIRIFAIVYSNFTDIPRIYIKDEINITDKTIIYDDTNDRYLSEISLEEFQAIKSFTFKADTIDIKDNRLFAAGIDEDVWDVEFDARVYQADEQGNVLMSDKDSIIPLYDIYSGDATIDPFVVYNNPDPTKYKYNTVYGPQTNVTTSTVGENSQKDVYQFMGLISDKLTKEQFEQFKIVKHPYAYGYYHVHEIDRYYLTDDMYIISFPLSCIYFIDYATNDPQQVQHFWGGLDENSQEIYVISAISYDGISLQQSALFEANYFWYSLANGNTYKIIETDSISKYELIPTTSSETPKLVFPEGGCGPNVSYMFVRPIMYLAPNASKTSFVDGIRLISKDNNQNEFGETSQIDVMSANVGNNWKSIHTIQKDINCDHKIKNITYKDPYICSNFTGFKQGESYTFGIIFYNKSHIPSPVHYIGTINIPYFSDWIFGGVSQNGQVHDLLATSVGIRFKINLSGLRDQQDVVAYEIVRVQKTSDTRKVLMQGVVSNTLEYKKNVNSGGTSLGDSDLRVPIYPTISKKFYTRYCAKSGQSMLENTTSDYVVLISPEISINKNNSSQILDGAKTIYVHNLLSSVLCDTSRNLNDSHLLNFNQTGGPCWNHLPLYPYVSYMTVPGDSYTLNKETYKHNKVAGIPYSLVVTDYSGISLVQEACAACAYDSEMGYGLFKYYIPSNSPNRTLNVESIQFCQALPIDQLGDSSINNAVTIYNKQFVNTVQSSNVDHQDQVDKTPNRIGVHSNCAIIKLNNNLLQYSQNPIMMKLNWSQNLRNYRSIDPLGVDQLEYCDYSTSTVSFEWPIAVKQTNAQTSRNTVALVDVCTRYNDFISYSMLPQLQYVSTGQYVDLTNAEAGESYVNCFGGDTYVCIHKELWSGFGYDAEYTNNVLSQKACINIKYPVETRVNLDRVTGPNYDTIQPNPMLTFEPAQLLQYGSQELPLNAYNDAYSAQEYNKVFVTKGTWDIENQRIGNRIVSSEVKSMGELTDSFQNFKIANYIDVDGQYGDITNLVNYNGKLYYLQATAFGTVAINERSLITDNNQAALLLGTGDVLSRFDYISTFNGSKHTNDPSIIVSPSSLYWYDSSKHSLLVFNQGGLNSLSKVKQVQTYFDNVVKDSIIHSGYDHRYNEVWFSPETDSKSMIYSEQTQAFVGFYAKTLAYPQTMESFSFGLSSKQNAKFIKFGVPSDVEFKDACVQFVVNTNPALPKVYDTVVVTDCGTPSKLGDKLSFDLQFETVRQGVASQTKPVDKEGVYYTVVGRDSNKERMRDKIMTVKLTLNTDEFHIPSVSTMFRYSRV